MSQTKSYRVAALLAIVLGTMPTLAFAQGPDATITKTFKEEATYPFAKLDENGHPIVGSKHAYQLTFKPGQLPPANASWSITMYDANTQLLVDNPIKRYLINSPMLSEMKKNADGSLHGDEKIASPAGIIELQDSFFGPDASEKIYAEMDYQRACQCYLWSHPLVSMKTWQEEQARAFDAHGDSDFVVLQTLDEKRGVVTGNLTTPYIINFINLSDSPILIDYPAGRTLTGFLDLWQRPFGYAGLTGPDRGKGGRYVLVGPGTKIDDVVVANARVFQSPTNNVAFTQRILDDDPEFYAKFKSEMRIGRLGKPLMECRFIEGRDAKWSGTAPRGIAYWERLVRLINEEPVRPIDKAWMAMLLPLGIKRGTEFAPNEHQREALLKGAAMGDLMARNLQVFPRFTKPYWDGTQWYKSFDFSIEQELPERIELDERTTWFYEAVTSSKEMVTPHVGSGQVYMTTKRDSEGRML